MKLTTFVLAGAMVVGAASTALAGSKVLASAPAPRTIPVAQAMFCDITNVDTLPRDVTIEALDVNGAVVDGPYLTTVAPGAGDYMQATSTSAAWCRFTVASGNTKKLRAMAIYDNGTAYNISLPAE